MAILITGGSKGIGRAIAERFSAPGVKVFVNYASDDAAAQDLMGCSIKQQFCKTFIPAVGNRTTRCRPRKHPFGDRNALLLSLDFCEAHPRHLRIGVSH